MQGEDVLFVKSFQLRECFATQVEFTEVAKDFCENASFNPGHSLIVHQPLGGINRARKVVMKAISDERLKENGVDRFEPTGHEEF